MSLTTRLALYVTNSTQHKGRSYYRAGRVEIVESSPTSVQAEVEGSDYYDVRLQLGKKDNKLVLGAECTCPMYYEYCPPCKHIWATLLKADYENFLQTYGDPVSLITDPETIEDLDKDLHDVKSAPSTSARPAEPRPAQPRPAPPPPPPSWQKALEQLKRSTQAASRQSPSKQPPCQFSYVIDLVYIYRESSIPLEVRVHDRLKKGGWSRPTVKLVTNALIEALEDPVERHHMTLFQGVPQNDHAGYSGAYRRYHLTRPTCALHIPWMSDLGRLYLRTSQMKEPEPLQWDTGEPWSLRMEWTRDAKGKRHILSGVLARGEEQLPLAEALIHCGMVFAKGRVGPLDEAASAEWLALLRKEKQIAIADADRDRFVTAVSEVPTQMPFEFPEEFGITFQSVTPRGALKVRPMKHWPEQVEAFLSFQYGGHIIADADTKSSSYSSEHHLFTRRDIEEEQALRGRLQQLGFIDERYANHGLRLAAKKLPGVVRQLTEEGWQIEAEGKLYRSGGEIKFDVASNIDWFELHAQVQFGDQSIPLPRLLQALRKGEKMVTLDDGSFGILPEDWLKKYGIFASVGQVEGDTVRFKKAQVGLLDALLAAQPEASFDAAFTKARDEFRSFEGVAPVQPPESFQGSLRGYQSEGLGWLLFLNRFGWGGCLADDMGLGKTVQVLALLTHQAAHRKKNDIRPSLIVAPRSLMFNWSAEAARFAPQLSVLDHHRLDRVKDAKAFADHDIVLTTYGILRRDAALFAECQFDYCILDESQAIKNASTEQAKAVRLLQGNHRLAMSGTPIENHLGELWSLFEFLNPGMLGAASVFKITGVGARNPDPETRELLSKALRPMILRRTKSQVAKDLPEKTEQTVYCDLDAEQRKLYDELRDYYRGALLKKIADDGMNKAKIMVLEALLRLRQAACHPALIDKKHLPIGSAKLDVLLPQLREVFEEGHKAIVFSQFTTFLGIVKKELDKDKIPYEYLDGKTRDRAARVERFQNDPDCKLFLISLKAGGMGLNLTAAEYVFLLDPWWNPAVEAQAIDRAHRIGQTKPVFAYRLIARGTVEEKVLELQKNKRELADAILNSDNSLISGLKREDLEMLLS